MNLQSRVRELVAKFLEGPSRHIVVAYSGGVDSHLLLITVAELATRFATHRYTAVHVNHGLSPNADDWQQHCQQVCNQLNFPLNIQHVKVEADGNGGVEAAARKVRYRAIEAMTEHHGLILLGQHIQDQLETVLLQLKRGAGPKGLSAMAQATVKENGITLARPFLDVEKQDILQLAKQKQLRWIEDESNQDTRFDRNFLRSQVLPKLSKRWPNLASAVHRSAQLCAEQQSLLDEVNAQRLQTMVNQRFGIQISKLCSLSTAWQNQIVRYWLAEQNVVMPSQSVLAELPKLLSAKQDANPQIQINQYQLRRFRDYLYCIKVQTVAPDIEINIVNLHTLLPNDLGHISVTEKYLGDLTLTSPVNSLKFKPQGDPHSKQLKQWFKQWDIPVWERQRSLLLFLHKDAIAVICDKRIIFANNTPAELIDTIHFRTNPPEL